MTMMFWVTPIINFPPPLFATVSPHLSHTLLLRRFGKAGAAMALMVLFALGIGAQGVTDLIYGTNPITFTPSYANDSWVVFGYQIPLIRFFAFVMAVALLGAFHLIRQHSK